MEELRDKLTGAAPLDVGAELQRLGQKAPELLHLRELSLRGVPLICRVQRALDALRLTPCPATAPGPWQPWWTPVPALYAAALLRYAGLGRVGAGEALTPHARDSATIARGLLRRIGFPFTDREHAVALILHQCRPADLISSGAPPETYMRLACRVDLHSLSRLCAADPDAELRPRLEAFCKRAEELGALYGPPAPPVEMQRIADLGFEDADDAHRVANALRYFRLRAGLVEPQWFEERLRQERRRPRGRLNLLIGPAGCGKSRWALENMADTRIISSDRMRTELTGDPADQSQNYLAFQRCMDQVRALLKDGETVTFDATNCSEDLRDMPVQAARWSGAAIHSYFFDVDLETALSQNRTRERQVPEPAIRRHFHLLTPPALYEADWHQVVDDGGRAQLYWPVRPE